MIRFQKVLFALLAVVAFGVSNALAVTFSAGGGNTQVRSPGQTEAVSPLLLTVSSIAPSATITAGSSIVVSYDGELTNDGDLAIGFNIICTVCPTGLEQEDNQLILEFDADTVFAVGNTINIVEIRIDVSETSGTAVNADLSGQSATPGLNPIIFSPSSVRVANIVRPPLEGELADRADLGLGDLDLPANILTCDPEDIDDDFVNVAIAMKERGPAMYRSEGQEEDVADFPDDPNSGTTLVFVFKNVPQGFIIRPTAVTDEDGAAGTVVLGGDLGEDGQKVSEDDDGEDLTFEFEVEDSDDQAIETVVVQFAIGSDGGDNVPAGGLTGNIDVEVSLGPLEGEDDDVVRFADNIQFDDTVAIVADCQSFLLFSWNANTADGAYNTGYAVNNSGLAPDPLGADGEIGSVTLWFYPKDGGTPTSRVIAEALEPGETATFVLSDLGSPFEGYVIAVCNFRFGHGINFLSNFTPGGYAQGFQAIGLFNPRPNIEITGH